MTETDFRDAVAELFPLVYRDTIRNAENCNSEGYFETVFSTTRIRSLNKMCEYTLGQYLPLHYVKDDGWVVYSPDYFISEIERL